MEKITFEMAQELNLIPKPVDRLTTTKFPFESELGFQRRGNEAEAGYRIELQRIKKDYKTVLFRGETLEVI